MDRSPHTSHTVRSIATASPFGLGLSRIGLVPIRMPVTAAIVIALVSLLAVVGMLQVKTDDALSDLFRSKTPVYVNYKKLIERFPGSDADLFLVVEGDGLLQRSNLEEIRTLHLELNFAEAVGGVTSMFSVREPPDKDGTPAPLFPAELPEGNAYRDLITRAEMHPLIAGRLLSDRQHSGRIALLVVALKPDVLRDKGLRASINEIRDFAREIILPTGLRFALTGAPVMKLELVEATRRDRIVFNVLGFGVGFLICFLFFRDLRLVAVANVAPAVAVLWSLALLGYWGVSLNPLNSTIMPLVMVITFTDGMHLTFAIKRQIERGADRFRAAKHAAMTVGPACALTSLTTSIALLSLLLTDSALIQSFGITAAASTLLAFIAVITVVPMIAVLLLHNESSLSDRWRRPNHQLVWLDNVGTWIGRLIDSRHLALTIVGISLVAVSMIMYMDLRPHYRLSDIVPDGGQAARTLTHLDEKLAGVHPLQIMVESPEGESVYSDRMLSALADTDRILRNEEGIRNVWSIDTLRRWLGGPQRLSREQLEAYIQKLPAHLQKRFLNVDKHSIVVSGYMPDLTASQVVGLAQGIERALVPIRSRYPELTFTVTGLSLVSAARSIEIIGQLNISLLGAVAVVILLIGVAFRSVLVAGLSAVPNLFALVATGAILYLFGKKLEYSSVVALTVAFGLAVDDTIHFLNRYRLERLEGRQPRRAVLATIDHIGPVLVLTTIVLVFGLAVTGLSDLPPIRLFGGLCIVTLLFALLGDLVFLPAILLSIDRYGVSRREMHVDPEV